MKVNYLPGIRTLLWNMTQEAYRQMTFIICGGKLLPLVFHYRMEWTAIEGQLINLHGYSISRYIWKYITTIINNKINVIYNVPGSIKCSMAQTIINGFKSYIKNVRTLKSSMIICYPKEMSFQMLLETCCWWTLS